MYNSIGVSAFVLKYRVPARPQLAGLPKWWAPLQDAQRAIGLVRANAKQYGLNASRIGFTGGSAGGHLTAHISTTFAARAYAKVDASDEVSCRPDFSIFQYPWMLLPDNKVPAWGD
jgi:acetyl esterase/lipase